MADFLIPASHDAAIAAVTWIASLCCALLSLEILLDRRAYADDGLLGWPVAQTRSRLLCLPIADYVFHYRVFTTLVATRLVAAIAIVVGVVPDGWMPYVVVHLAITALLLAGRTSFGMDGADQKQTLVFFALGIAALVPTPTVEIAALWFITAQLALSYLVSGVTKLFGKSWRSGAAIWGVLSTRMYGMPALGAWFRDHPRIAAIMSWSVVLSETVFAGVLLAPDPIAWGLIAGGAAFHLAAAVIMGLNTFLWSFLAAYPALIWCRFG